MKKLILFLVFMSLFCSLKGQGIEEWVNSKKAVLYEKVYLHIDRELYAPGDTIWFKAYLVSGMTNKMITGYKNIYAQLISSEGKVISSRMLLSINGESNSDFALPDTLPDDQYTIRAYTRYLENFGEESFFHKHIKISKPKRSEDYVDVEMPEAQKIDVMFFPEGGSLVLNSINYIAFKAIGSNGKSVEASGYIEDESGEKVTAFQTNFLGMGKFILMPTEGKTYYAKINKHPEFHLQLGPINEKGIALNFRDVGNEVLIVLSRNIKITGSQTFYLAASHKGVVLFYKEISLNNFSETVRLSKNQFPLGISKISLLDRDLNMVAERLVFIKDTYQNSIQINLTKEEFSTREKIELSVEPLLTADDSMGSTLSVAVVNEDYFSSSGNNQTTESYLLVDSELKGAIESPASYFFDGDSISSAQKLDLLMMVQGWRNYFWDDIVRNAPVDRKGWDDVGITVEGYVKRLLVNKPVVGGTIVLGPFSRNLLFEEAKTDQNGRFKFDRLYLKDTSQIILHAKNERDRSNTEIIPDPALPVDTIVEADKINNTLADIGIPMKFYRKNYFRQLAKQEFSPEKGDILLKGVDVIGQKPVNEDGHFRIYSQPDNALKVTEDDFIYSNIFDYLTGKVAGVIVTGEQISIRGEGTPLFVLDGVITLNPEASIFHMHMQDIDKIEILKSVASESIYGSKGANGVILVYTNKGDNKTKIDRYIKGRIILRANGFQKPNQFYSPKYTPENRTSDIPDTRPTLYWSPTVNVKDGKANVGFFTCDDLSYYIVFVEGISSEGKICFGTKRFSVVNTGQK